MATNIEDYPIWATLKPEVSFWSIFPTGNVPIVSIIPTIYAETTACYLIDGSKLNETQVTGLAQLIADSHTANKTFDEAVSMVKNNQLPIRTAWFSDCGTTSIGVMSNIDELMSNVDNLLNNDYLDDEEDYYHRVDRDEYLDDDW